MSQDYTHEGDHSKTHGPQPSEDVQPRVSGDAEAITAGNLASSIRHKSMRGNAAPHAATMLQAQRAHGNRAVQRLVQRFASEQNRTVARPLPAGTSSLPVQREETQDGQTFSEEEDLTGAFTAPTSGDQSGDTGGGWASTLWKTITNNAVSGIATGVEHAGQVASKAGKAFKDINLVRSGAPLTLSPAMKALGKATPVTGPISKALGPLGVVSNAMSMYDTLTKPGKNSLSDTGDLIASGAGLASSGIATAGMLGVGAASTGALAEAAPVLGAFAAGWEGGKLLDKGVNWGRHLSDDKGDDPNADLSITGSIGRGLYSADKYITGKGDDPSKPEYTQTAGWWLADNLPSWLQ